MTKRAAPEDLLNEQLATCLAAMQDCLAHARTPQDDDPRGHLRRADLDYVAKLVKASVRLTEALARLKGETRHNIHVHRDADKRPG
jgi:hypothetical protein